MSSLRTKGTGQFKVVNKNSNSYLRCKYNASDKSNTTAPQIDPTPTGPFYYEFFVKGTFAFQAALTEIEMYDTNNTQLTINTADLSDVYSCNGFMNNISVTDVSQLFDSVTNPATPLEYYHNFQSGTPPNSGFKIFTLETQHPVNEVHIHYNMWGLKPADNGSWTFDIIHNGVTNTITEFGDFVTAGKNFPAIINMTSQ